MAQENKGKDSIMKMLLLSTKPCLPSSELASKADKIKINNNRETEEGVPKLCNYLQSLSGNNDDIMSTVELDHNYSRPWNWRPENSYTKPVKTLFMSRNPNTVSRCSTETIDIEEEKVTPKPVYDLAKAHQLMEECETHIGLVRSEVGDPDWEANVKRSDWTPSQTRLFDRVCRLLNHDMLARLSSVDYWNEPLLRRVSINKTARRFRSLFASLCWDTKLIQWIHNLLMEILDIPHLIAYIEVLQTLKSKVPTLVDRMQSNPTTTKINVDGLNMLLQRPWDPSAFGLTCYNPKKLPGNPILLIVPNGPNNDHMSSSRFQRWHTFLSLLGTVVTVNTSINCALNKVSVMSSLEHMMTATRSKISELRLDYMGRHIILIGFNTGAALACQVALLEHVTSVVCLGFPLNTVEDKRGQPDDSILNLSVPVLFIIGQHAATASVDDMEDLRERLHVETGLVVVGAADDQLRICKGKQGSEGITQSMIDRCVVDEIGDFVGTILSNPYSSGRNDIRPRMKLIEKKRKMTIQDEGYGKKQQYSSTGMIQSGSSYNSTTPRKPRVSTQRNNTGRPKWTAAVHRSVDVKPRPSFSQASSGSSASITRTAGGVDKTLSNSSRPSIDNISIVNATSGDGDIVSNSSLDTSAAKLLPQIKVLGSEECGITINADSSLVEQLTPDSLLEMPVIIAQEDAQESPVKVVVSSKCGNKGLSSIKCITKGQNQMNCTQIFLRKKDIMKKATLYMDSRNNELKPRIRHFPATQHSENDLY